MSIYNKQDGKSEATVMSGMFSEDRPCLAKAAGMNSIRHLVRAGQTPNGGCCSMAGSDCSVIRSVEQRDSRGIMSKLAD